MRRPCLEQLRLLVGNGAVLSRTRDILHVHSMNILTPRALFPVLQQGGHAIYHYISKGFEEAVLRDSFC